MFGSTMVAVRVSVTRPLPPSDTREPFENTVWRRVFLASIDGFAWSCEGVCGSRKKGEECSMRWEGRVGLELVLSS